MGDKEKENKAKLTPDGKYSCKPLGNYECKYYKEPNIKGKIGQYCIFVNKAGFCTCQEAIKEVKAKAKEAADAAKAAAEKTAGKNR